jgi:hypothetical protein
MTLGSSQPLTEMSIRNIPGDKRGRRVRLTSSPQSVSRLCRKFASLDVSHLYGPPRAGTDIALHSYMPRTEDQTEIFAHVVSTLTKVHIAELIKTICKDFCRVSG